MTIPSRDLERPRRLLDGEPAEEAEHHHLLLALVEAAQLIQRLVEREHLAAVYRELDMPERLQALPEKLSAARE